MVKPYDVGLVVGRFNHFHKGHEFLVETGLKICDRVLVLVGSSQEQGTLRNPFSVSTRIEMIKEVYGDKVIVRDLPDMTHEEDITPEWGRYVLDHVKYHIYKKPEIMIYGNDEARSKWFDTEDICDITEIIINRSKINISATKMREYLVQGDIDNWLKFANSKLHKHYGRLRDELLATKPYAEIYNDMKANGLIKPRFVLNNTIMIGQEWD